MALILAGSSLAGVSVTPAGDSPSAERVDNSSELSADDLLGGDVPEVAGHIVPASPPNRLSIPAIGFSARVRTDRTPRGGVVRPDDVVDAFWLSAYARPATNAKGTVYLAGHSSAAGGIVFDALLDSHGRPRDLAGLTIKVRTAAGTLRYVIQGHARVYAKNRIAHARQVWQQVPGRLLLITCDQSDSSKNAVFFAQAGNGPT